jgi:hypothetical protein
MSLSYPTAVFKQNNFVINETDYISFLKDGYIKSELRYGNTLQQ